jgi:FAD synthetase
MDLYNAILSDTSVSFAHETLKFIVDTIDEYGEESVSLCFNGGKDCTVLLHLIVAALDHIRNRNNGNAADSSREPTMHIPVVYFKVEEEFEELDYFNRDMMDRYRFSMVEFDGVDMKQCLRNMLEYFPKMKVSHHLWSEFYSTRQPSNSLLMYLSHF